MKFAIVTGASTGIGRAIAVELSKHGMTVGLVARRKEKLDETRKMVEEVGGKAEVLVCDLSDISQVNSLIQNIKAKTDEVDILVNVAGIWHGDGEVYAGKDFETFDQKVILDTYTVGFTAPTLLIHGLLPLMGDGSHVINLSGTFENGGKGWIPYFASKRALEDLTVGLADELKDKGIGVNCISPSDTTSEAYQKYFPEDAQDANTPEDIAELVIKIYEGNETGKFWVIKQGKITKDSYHK